MKIFIIYASAGFGHKKIAEAINEIAVTKYSNNDVSILDILDFTPSFLKTFFSQGYVFIISKLKWLWAILFYTSNIEFLKNLNGDFRFPVNKFLCNNFLEFLIKEKPDVIISTHFWVNELVSSLKEREIINSKLISVVTDFGVHNLWVAKKIDYYTVASNETKRILISKKVDAQKIYVFGLPVRRQFQRQFGKELIRNKLGIKKEGFTVLFLTGGIGMGPIYEIVKLLNDKINVIVICGKNKELYNRLSKLNYENLIILSWIDYVQEVMVVSDLIVTKPGGSTISECLIMELPMIFFSIIPGQEAQNAKILSNYGVGFIIKNVNKIKEKILFFRDNPKELNLIKEKIKKIKLTESSEKILGLIG